MKRRLGLGGAALALLVVLALSACNAPLHMHILWDYREPAPDGADASRPTATVAASPTTPPMVGPMGTLTAIAALLASPTPNRTPYEIVNEGRPHFLFFHAWW